MNKTPAPRPGVYLLLDAYRGIASLGVVAFHWAEMMTRRYPSLAQDPLYIASSYGFLGVQVFFVISGYCIAAAAVANLRRGDTLGSYFYDRVRRIYPTYWIGLTLAYLFYEATYHLAKRGMIGQNVFNSQSVFDQPWLYHIANFTLTAMPLHQPLRLTVAWTLCFEVTFYLIVGIALALSKRSAGTLLTLLHGLTVLTAVMLLVWPNFHIFPFDMWPQFGLGIFLYDLLAYRGDAKRERMIRTGFAATLGLLAIFAVLHDVPLTGLSQMSRLTFLVTVVFTLFLWMTHRFDSRWMALPPLRWLAFIGSFSYSLYLIHVLVLQIWSQMRDKLHLPLSLHLVSFLMAFLLTSGVAYLFFLLFERPFLKRRKVATSS